MKLIGSLVRATIGLEGIGSTGNFYKVEGLLKYDNETSVLYVQTEDRRHHFDVVIETVEILLPEKSEGESSTSESTSFDEEEIEFLNYFVKQATPMYVEPIMVKWLEEGIGPQKTRKFLEKLLLLPTTPESESESEP